MPALFDESRAVEDQAVYASGFEWKPAGFEGMIDEARAFGLAGTSLITLSGVSMAGKSTLLIKALEMRPTWAIVPRATRRPKRDGETDGKDYFFEIQNLLLWSRYGGYEYAVTASSLARLKDCRRGIMIQGTPIAPTLKGLLTLAGCRVGMVCILPGALAEGEDALYARVAERMQSSSREVPAERLLSTRAELHAVFAHQETLTRLGMIFIENTPDPTGYAPVALERLVALMDEGLA